MPGVAATPGAPSRGARDGARRPPGPRHERPGRVAARGVLCGGGRRRGREPLRSPAVRLSRAVSAPAGVEALVRLSRSSDGERRVFPGARRPRHSRHRIRATDSSYRWARQPRGLLWPGGFTGTVSRWSSSTRDATPRRDAHPRPGPARRAEALRAPAKTFGRAAGGSFSTVGPRQRVGRRGAAVPLRPLWQGRGPVRGGRRPRPLVRTLTLGVAREGGKRGRPFRAVTARHDRHPSQNPPLDLRHLRPRCRTIPRALRRVAGRPVLVATPRRASKRLRVGRGLSPGTAAHLRLPLDTPRRPRKG